MNAKTSNMTVIGKRSALILKLLFNVFVKMVLQERFKMTTKIAITAVKIDFFSISNYVKVMVMIALISTNA